MYQTDNISMNKNQNEAHSKISMKSQNDNDQYRISNADKMTTEELIGAIRRKIEQVL